MFKTFSTANADYNCKLSTRALVECEAILKTNPVNVFFQCANGDMPRLGDLLVILWCSMKNQNHGIKKDDIFDIYDAFCENGGDYLQLVEFVTELIEDSGLIKLQSDDEKESTGDTESPNA